jgi:hypothetical protein
LPLTTPAAEPDGCADGCCAGEAVDTAPRVDTDRRADLSRRVRPPVAFGDPDPDPDPGVGFGYVTKL